jgi:outer membrane protein OmpA-like peptidoglycan-associated protein
MRVLSVDTTASYTSSSGWSDSKMLSSASGGQPRGACRRVQAGCRPERRSPDLRGQHLALAFAQLLGGCSSLPASINPVSWWHDLQGGKIGEERPPPPGADQPYPNLASVPPKPAQPDRAALAAIASALVADRTNAQHLAAEAPIPDPSSPSASPGLFGRGTLPPPEPANAKASATMAAAEAKPAAPVSAPSAAPGTPNAASKPAPAQAPAKAPVETVQSAPLAPPGATAQPLLAAATPPPLPTTPPPPPDLPGVSRPAATAAPTPDTVASANSVSVAFQDGSAALPSTATDKLKQLAGRRGSGTIAVTGYGDAASDDPNAQSAALALGLSRAQAIAGTLTAAGVPSSAVAVDATAIGRGGTARLLP